MSDRLCVVMPVYNEQDAIGAVLDKWARALDALGIDYTIRPYNDGSKDNSLAVMRSAVAHLPRVDVRDGNTILTGYREAAADGFDWIFQIDSDDEMGPEKFGELWNRREGYDFLVGMRDGRKQALPRKVISFVSRLCVRIFYGKSVWDVNAPYRLMRVSAFREFYEAIPLATFAPNVILSGLVGRHRLRSFEMRVPQHDRTTGEVSIKKWKLLKAAARSFYQTICFALTTATARDWIRYVFWGAAWGLAALSVVAGVVNGFVEFDFQWDSAKLLMMGDNPYVYSLECRAIPYDGFVETFIVANQLPSCLLLLAPWTFLPQLLANQVWAFCNLAFTAVFLLYIYKMFFSDSASKDRFFLVPLILLAGMPWRMLVGNGQHLLFSLAFFMPAVYYAQRGRNVLAGVLLAMSAFKYTTIVPLSVIFFAKRWWMPIAIAAAIHVVATIGCGFWLGESPVVLIAQSLKVGSRLTACGRCDLASLAKDFGVVNVEAVAIAGYVLYGCLLVGIAFWRKCCGLLLLSILSVISSVMFYHGAYDFVVLTFPLAYVLSDEGARPSSVAVRWSTILNVAWIFFLYKGCHMLHLRVDAVIICFVLQHALLAALLWRLFDERLTIGHSRAHGN